jgi:hypothetical protein
VQYYGSPFISKGVFYDLKYVSDPENPEYQKRFKIFNNPEMKEDTYFLDENGDGFTDYSIDNPDFNFLQFRSNFVTRWEYRPGSALYLVWSGDLTGDASPVSVPLGTSMRQLWNIYPDNIFLVKFSYWLPI